MAGSSVVQIFNESGNLMIRNDIMAITLSDRGEFPECKKQFCPLDDVYYNNLKYKDPRFLCSWIDITEYSDPLVAVRPGEGVYATAFITYARGRRYAICFSDYYETPEYFIFERKAQRLSEFGLQLYHPDSGEVTFDSCWDFMMPERKVTVPFYQTVKHGIVAKQRPAFVATEFGMAMWNRTPNGLGFYTVLGLSVTDTEVSSRAVDITDPPDNNKGVRPMPNTSSTISAIMVNVDNL